MEKFYYIKHEGEVKEVSIIGIRTNFDPNNNLVMLTQTKCQHQGEEIGWGARKVYKDKLCQNLVDGLVGFNAWFRLKDDGSKYADSSLKEVYANIDGAMEKVYVYPKEMIFTDGVCQKCQLKVPNQEITLLSSEVYGKESDYKWKEDTKVVHNDGSVEVIQGEGKKWEFDVTQRELFDKFNDLIDKMRQNGLRVFVSTADWDVYVAKDKVEGYEIAGGDPSYYDNDEVEGCHEWDEVPSGAFHSVDSIEVFNCEQTLFYRKAEDKAND